MSVPIKTAAIACSSSGANTIVNGVSGKAIRVLGYVIVANGAVNAKWQSASADKTGLAYLAANGGVVAPMAPLGGGYWFDTAVGEALVLNLSVAVAVGGHVTYQEM